MTRNISRKYFTVLCLAGACSVSVSHAADSSDYEDLKKCRALATELNRTKNVGIDPDGMTRLVTWRAACAERPPTGPGNVTALCEGKRTSVKGGGKVFFWQKADHGKPNYGYFSCDD